MMYGTASKKKYRVRNELKDLGIDVENMEYSCDPDQLPEPRVAFGMLRHYAKQKKYKSAWSIVQYKNIFDSLPPRKWNSDPLIVPNKGLMVYVYAAAAAWRKQRDQVAAEQDEIKLAHKAREMQ